MNLKNKVFGLAAVAALSLSLAAPVALAQPAQSDDDSSNNTVPASVALTDTGRFDVFFNATAGVIGLTNVDVTASSGGTATGGFQLQYVDTKAYRNQFRASISATDFISDTPVPYGSGFYAIGAENFRITQTSNVIQVQCTGDYENCPAPDNGGYRVGDIGYYNGNGGRNADGSAWSASTGSLDTPRNVNYGWNGAGTITSYGPIAVALDVPAAIPADDYTSTVTVAITFTAP